jgi:hypothetical protein
VTDLDTLRAAVGGGDGRVARFPGLLVVAQGPDDAVRTLLELCRDVAGATPGRALARRLASWLGGADAPSEELRFGTVSATERGLAVFLSGEVSVLVPERGTTISGADAAAWADRLIEAPDAPVVLTVDGVSTPPDLLAVGVLDLREGVVPGIAVAITVDKGARPSAQAATTTPATEPVVVNEPAETPLPEPVAQAAVHEGVPTSAPQPAPVLPSLTEPPVLTPPLRAEPILAATATATEPAREPLEVGTPVTGAVRPGKGRPPPQLPQRPDEPQASGHLCSRGHLNDPRSHFCVLCGIRMNERTGVLVLGSRPPLGLMVFDDGATYTVDAEYLVGRTPEVDERVRSGELRSILVEDRSGSVSRVHAEIRLNGWDVVLVDSGSSNGTFVAAPGEQAWVQVPPRTSRKLVPGTRVRLGARMFVFESPSGVR